LDPAHREAEAFLRLIEEAKCIGWYLVCSRNWYVFAGAHFITQ
jgi:hypothetical protein